MDDKVNIDTTFGDDDLNTTDPSPKPDPWTMPEPVFRQTSGKLPQGFEKNYESDLAASASAEVLAASDTPLVDTERGNIPASIPEPKPVNATFKLVLVLLGLAAMIAFIVAFLTVLYFFFWRTS